MRLVRFIVRHWICTLVLITVIFAVVLPNLANLFQSGVATLIQEVLI